MLLIQIACEGTDQVEVDDPDGHADGDADSDADADADADGDTDADTDADADTDTGGDTGEDTGEAAVRRSAFLLYALGDDDCHGWASLTVHGPDGTTTADLDVDKSTIADGWSAEPGVAYSYQGDSGFNGIHCGQSSGGGAEFRAPTADEYYEMYMQYGDNWAMWRAAGVDYDDTRLRVRFADGLDASYAEYVLADFPVSISVTVGSDPPQYIVDTTDGTTSPDLAVQLIDHADITWARPEDP